MFFNAGRMGFRHFVSVASPGDGGPGGDTYCFGLTGTEHVVFGFDAFGVPDRPAFAYIYDCTMAYECIGYDRGSMYAPVDCDNPQGRIFELPPAGLPEEQFCACTGDHVRGLGCFFNDLAGQAGGSPNLNCGQQLEVNGPCTSGPGDIYCRSAGDDSERNSTECCGELGSDCRNYGHTFCVPSKEEFCEFCYGSSGGDEQCGISVPYVSPACLCTTATCGEGCGSDTCVNTCNETIGLSYLGPQVQNVGQGGCVPTVDVPTDLADEFAQSGKFCVTSSGYFVSIQDIAPGITNSGQIKPGRMLNITGNDCKNCSGSAYKAFFAYLTVDSAGVTLCNLFMTPTINGPCSPPHFSEAGCTFSLAGYTGEEFNSLVSRYPSHLYMNEFGCAKGIVRSNYTGNPTSENLFDESRRIDHALIDTCGINPCGCSDSTVDVSDGVGFTGGSCRKFMNDELYNPQQSASRYYDPYFSTCDAGARGADTQSANTGDFVVNPLSPSSRTPFAREAVNRVGIRSEELFDLPLVSVGVARSFFAPWTDNFIDRSAINAASHNTQNDYQPGVPYPASNYHSWFTGPMFDIVHSNGDQFANSGSAYDVMSDRGGEQISSRELTMHAQGHPQMYGNFITPPGFFGYSKDARENITNRGYFNSWGSVKLNEFYRQDPTRCVWTGGTLPSFNEALSTGRDAPPLQTPGAANPSATHLQLNPMGITGHCGMGWCSMIGKQNCSWLNPRFTVLSNWLWIGNGNSAAWKPGSDKYAGSTMWTDAELDIIMLTSVGPRNGESNSLDGGNDESVGEGLFQLNERVMMVNPSNEIDHLDPGDPDFTTGGLPKAQYPCSYVSPWNRPEWTTALDNKLSLDFPAKSGSSEGEIAGFAAQQCQNDTLRHGGEARQVFGQFRDAFNPHEENQRFSGMDRWELSQVIPHQGGLLGVDDGVVDGIIPSPSLLSYYPLNVVGGYLYAGPFTNDDNGQPTVSLSDLNKVTGIGNANGYLYGGFGRDIMWSQKGDRVDKSVYKNPDGSECTGATSADSGSSDQFSSHHAQRLFANGADTNAATTALALGKDPTVTGKRFDSISECVYYGWQHLTASHCLLDISSNGISTIGSKFAGCTAYYRPPSAGAFPATNGSDAEATYQFNGNGWWYRSHEQLRRGINECGWTCGIGPAGWVKHENGWYPGYFAGDYTKPDVREAAGQENTGTGDNRYTGAEGDYFTDSATNLVRQIQAGVLGDGADIGESVDLNDYVLSAEQNVENPARGITDGFIGSGNLNNGWTACAITNSNPATNYTPSVSVNYTSGVYGSNENGHFPDIAPEISSSGADTRLGSAYYPTNIDVGEIGQGLVNYVLVDDLVFDAVFAWKDGLSAGFGGHAGIEANGYFTLIAQDGSSLQIRATGGSASCVGTTYSDPVNLNIRPYDDSLSNFGATANLLCATEWDINKPQLGACSRINDKTRGGFDDRVSRYNFRSDAEPAEIAAQINFDASYACPEGISGA